LAGRMPVAAGTPWDVPADTSDPRSQLGSWGGHCMAILAYDEAGVNRGIMGRSIRHDLGSFGMGRGGNQIRANVSESSAPTMLG